MSTQSVHYSIRVLVTPALLRALSEEALRRRLVEPDALIEALLTEALAAAKQRCRSRGRTARQLHLVPSITTLERTPPCP